MQAVVQVGHQGQFQIIFKIPLRVFKGLYFVRAASHHLPAREEPSHGLEAQCPYRACLVLLHFYCSLHAETGNAVLEGDLYLCGEVHMPRDGAAALVKVPCEASGARRFSFKSFLKSGSQGVAQMSPVHPHQCSHSLTQP